VKLPTFISDEPMPYADGAGEKLEIQQDVAREVPRN
jgi:hypothetical protein